MSFSHHPSSYRDPSGFVFNKDGQLYRQVNQVFREDFEFFVSSGLYDRLVKEKILIAHKQLNENLTGTPEWHTTLKPEMVGRISYPYEWCFDMLRDAALTTLHIAKEAMNHGMMLKDASAYNLQWHEGKMCFIDSLSFEKYDENQPWIAYRQFCEHFYAPLALMHYLQIPLQPMLLGYADGLPLALASRMLPFRSRLNLHVYLNLHLHAKVSGKKTANKTVQPFSRKKMLDLLRSLEESIGSFSFDSGSGVWSGYYDEALQRETYINHKTSLVKEWLTESGVKSIFDAGANEGNFTLLAATEGREVVSADMDHYSINRLYQLVKKENKKNILPLVVDLSHPSPAIGVNNKERDSFSGRIKVDLVMALALVHHLVVGKNISFEQVAQFFQNTGKYLLIEFVPKEDEKLQLMLSQKPDIYTGYNRENFTRGFEKYYSIVKEEKIEGSERTLYLMKAHD